ncbi:Clp1/GlmU family protein [Sphingosinicella sp. CPCC 101087]|uniref:Clp1/GlmU family protein n=1 Tax=Sphingosinicella sp. CPCC 101087 TaxID=2497754 RepID=UPI00101C3EEB|nr:Clp1/GlmU family protein [Sphingosinicella sp. CPCC 101087]
MDEPGLHLPPPWESALLRGTAARRLVVLGPTDVGKSRFIDALAARRPDAWLVDLDPGQKMIGAPGTAALGRHGGAMPERFVFLGSTAVGSFRALAAAGAELAASTGPDPVIVNTPGHVAGAGARLQAMILAALDPDLVVAIGAGRPLEAELARLPALDRIAIEPSPFARRKTKGLRRAVRQAGFAAALADAGQWSLSLGRVGFEPGAPQPTTGTARAVCALADEEGEAMEIAILIAKDADRGTFLSRPPVRPPARILLGKMWAQPSESGWILQERLAPSWEEAP